MTENAVCLGGRLHKIHHNVVFDLDFKNLDSPWRIRSVDSETVDLTLSPCYSKHIKANLLVASAALWQSVGRFSGTIPCGGGRTMQVDGLLGWAEEMHAKW